MSRQSESDTWNETPEIRDEIARQWKRWQSTEDRERRERTADQWDELIFHDDD